jgi:CubicO group peptidase (beta-lactamase class C family)
MGKAGDQVATVLETLPARVAACGCPGAAAAVCLGGVVREAAAGVADTGTGTPVTPGTLFGAWSAAKVLTATVLARLSAAGHLDLDAPAARYLPEFAETGDGRDRVTVAQLLSHTSGLDGDALADLGDGDDCRQRYVRGLGRVRQLFAPGKAYGYCNAGYVVLGALAERVTGTVWEDLLQATVLDPAGLAGTTPRGRGSAPGPVASGHVRGPDGRLRPVVDQYAPWRCCAPCGSATYATAADLARLGALHLPAPGPIPGTATAGLAGLGVLRQPVIAVPGYEHEQRASCLGWKSLNWHGTRVLAADGGAHAFLRVIPGAGMSIAVMVNGPGGPQLARPLIADLVQAIAGARSPRPPRPGTPPPGFDLTRYAGRYHAAGLEAAVTCGEGGLVLAIGGRAPATPLAYLTPANFTARGIPVSFTLFDQAGRPHAILIAGSRIAVKGESTPPGRSTP